MEILTLGNPVYNVTGNSLNLNSEATSGEGGTGLGGVILESAD
ncbi:hypothetical protein AB6805_00245 [Chitinophaga sp. RCC_12]